MRTTPSPPRLARLLLDRLLTEGANREALLGDLEELHAERVRARSRIRADLWYLREALFIAVRFRALGANVRSRGAKNARPRPGLAHWMAEAGRELRTALRRLRQSPGFAVAAVLTLALGIAASAAVLTVTYGILLKPLPYPHADRLVVIEHELPGFEMPGGRTATFGGIYALLDHYRERSRSFREIGGFAAFDATVAGEGDPQFLRMATATAGYFRALGISPFVGRLLKDEDPSPDDPAGGPTLLSHGLWSQRFGRDPDVLGRILEAQGFPNEIVGVLPASYAFPPTPISLWGSLPVSRLRNEPEWQLTMMLGRLAPGVTPEMATEELNGLIPELPDRAPGAMVRRAVVEGGLRARVTPLRTWLVGSVERSLWLLLAAAGLVLAIACANVTSLILVRAESRRRELLVRKAMGASTGDLARYFLLDSAALVSVAAAAGTALAMLGVYALLRFSPSSLPRLEAVDAGWNVAVFSGGPALACMAIFAIVSWLACGRSGTADLRRTRGATAGGAELHTRHALVAVQFAMAVVLLVGAGLIVRSFLALTRVDLGFQDRQVLTFRVAFPFQEIRDAGPGAPGPATPFYDALAERLRSLSGVEAVGYGTCVPLSDACSQGGLSLRREDDPDKGGNVPATLMLRVSPGYLRALDVPLLKGRTLEPRDHQQRTNAVLISAEAARRFFPSEDPVGLRLVQDGTSWTPFTIVGVVGDVKHEDPRKETTPFAYLPMLGDFASYEPWAVSYVVRASGSPLALVEAIRVELEELRPDIPLAHVETLSGLVARSTESVRFALWLLALAAGASIVLSTIGAYGLVAYAVSLRRSELGIRLALGADARALRSMVLRQGATAAAAGLLVGVSGAAITAGLLRSLLFEIAPSDPPTYVVVLGGLALTALVAVYVPARAASTVDPSEVLRAE